MNVKVDTSNSGIPALEIEAVRGLARNKLNMLFGIESESDTSLGLDESPELESTGWVDFPHTLRDSDFEIIETLAQNIRENSDVLLVLGVGGSYMGAKALTDMIPGDGNTEVVFYGYDFSVRHKNALLRSLENLDYSVLAVSKSGGTMEPMAAFSIMMDELTKRYGEDEAAARTYVVTEDKKSALHDYAEAINCHIVHMPKDIGGRYSIFTAVGLLPLAVHGIDIRELISGARSLAEADAFSGDGLDYAICRHLYGTGDKPKTIEAFEVFDPYAEYFGNWLQQLFGESEGKDGKGIFPTVLMFNRDLHSMGQFLQQGSPTFFETMLFFGPQEGAAEIPETDILPELSHKNLVDISLSVEQGVLEAHKKGGIPLITISVDEITPRSMGELMYFFMIQCAVSALLWGVNPFDQPGVEAYKAEVKKWIRG